MELGSLFWGEGKSIQFWGLTEWWLLKNVHAVSKITPLFVICLPEKSITAISRPGALGCLLVGYLKITRNRNRCMSISRDVFGYVLLYQNNIKTIYYTTLKIRNIYLYWLGKLYIVVIVFSCCVTDCHKFRNLK